MLNIIIIMIIIYVFFITALKNAEYFEISNNEVNSTFLLFDGIGFYLLSPFIAILIGFKEMQIEILKKINEKKLVNNCFNCKKKIFNNNYILRKEKKICFKCIKIL